MNISFWFKIRKRNRFYRNQQLYFCYFPIIQIMIEMFENDFLKTNN